MKSTSDAISDLLFVEYVPAYSQLIIVLCSEYLDPGSAVELLNAGYAPLAVVSGGKSVQGESEAQFISSKMIKAGIPMDKLLLETRSMNTLENILFSFELLQQSSINLDDIRNVILVSTPFHSRRSLMTARKHIPSHVAISCYPGHDTRRITRENWWLTGEGRRVVMQELQNIGAYYLKGDIGDF